MTKILRDLALALGVLLAMISLNVATHTNDMGVPLWVRLGACNAPTLVLAGAWWIASKRK